MDLLPLPFIGWFFSIAAVIALAAGAMLIMAMHRAGELERRMLERNAWNDAALFAIWIVGLAGGVGVLGLQPWGRHILEFFCWTLIALTVLSAISRLRLALRATPERSQRTLAIAGITLVLLPIVAICGATIATLRSDATRAAFAG